MTSVESQRQLSYSLLGDMEATTAVAATHNQLITHTAGTGRPFPEFQRDAV
jgi:hypothetical protein